MALEYANVVEAARELKTTLAWISANGDETSQAMWEEAVKALQKAAEAGL